MRKIGFVLLLLLILVAGHGTIAAQDDDSDGYPAPPTPEPLPPPESYPDSLPTPTFLAPPAYSGLGEDGPAQVPTPVPIATVDGGTTLDDVTQIETVPEPASAAADQPENNTVRLWLAFIAAVLLLIGTIMFTAKSFNRTQ